MTHSIVMKANTNDLDLANKLTCVATLSERALRQVKVVSDTLREGRSFTAKFNNSLWVANDDQLKVLLSASTDCGITTNKKMHIHRDQSISFSASTSIDGRAVNLSTKTMSVALLGEAVKCVLVG